MPYITHWLPDPHDIRTHALRVPLYLYPGIITFAALITTATLGYLFLKGKFGVKFIWHKYMAITTIVIAIIHATLVVSAYFF
jgi:hypothetical protein